MPQPRSTHPGQARRGTSERSGSPRRARSPARRTMNELQINPAKTVLILIDLQHAILSRETAPHTAAQVVENSKKLAEIFRAKGATVVYVRVDINDFLELPVDESSPMGPGPFPAILSEIAPSAGFQTGDTLIVKRHWGAFAGTDLDEQLKSRGVDTIVLAGIST